MNPHLRNLAYATVVFAGLTFALMTTINLILFVLDASGPLAASIAALLSGLYWGFGAVVILNVPKKDDLDG